MLIAAMLIALANAAQPYSYMEQLRAAEQAVDEAQPGPQKFQTLHMLALAQSFVGEARRAQATNAQRLPEAKLTPDEHAKITAQVATMVADFEARDALATIVEQARNRRIVILNEAHPVSRHRAFATLLALELRKQGFDHLAVETLTAHAPERIAELQRRGYPLVEDGHYSREPLFGDFLRRSLAAGYKLVAYEHAGIYSAEYAQLTAVERQIQREEGQARNIMDRVFAVNPRARVFIYVGHGHVNKGITDFDGRMIALMAERLREKSGTEPLCIDQTTPTRPALAERDRLLMDKVFELSSGDSIAMASKHGTFWNGGKVDMQVWHRPAVLRQGREHWLAMDGYRRARAIPVKLLPHEGRRLIQAFVAGESPDAVPMDQVMVTAGEAPPVLMLPRGRYRFAYQD
jgi:hypothetical protein